MPSSFLPGGCPGRDRANYVVTGLVWGGSPCMAPPGDWGHAGGCREGASMASDVPAAVLALGLPLQGGQLKQPPHPHHWTEQPFSCSHGSDKGTQGALFSPSQRRSSALGSHLPSPCRGQQQLGDPPGATSQGASAPCPHAVLLSFLGGRGGHILSHHCCLCRGKQEES